MTPTLPAQNASSPRLKSIDAYRGWVMLLMMAEVLHFSQVSSAFPHSAFWRFLAHHQSHVEWVGCSLHDLIQPSFSFLVGVGLPFSLARRRATGASRSRILGHACLRSLILVLLGIFLRSVGRSQTNWTFEDTLTQIGLGYLFLVILSLRPVREQWIALAVILLGYWAAFAIYPTPGKDFDYSTVGVEHNWAHLSGGFAAHWNKNSNLAWAFDRRFLNLFPRSKPFQFNGGGYATLSFIPTLATMILGLLAGQVLRQGESQSQKLRVLVLWGAAGLLAGTFLGWAGICPVVKRIWTPSWVLFSGGWCFLFMALFVALLDYGRRKEWAFPFVVIGMNSIAAYCIAHLCEGFISQSLTTHLGKDLFQFAGHGYAPLWRGACILLVMWLLLFWMYRRKVFLRI